MGDPQSDGRNAAGPPQTESDSGPNSGPNSGPASEASPTGTHPAPDNIATIAFTHVSDAIVVTDAADSVTAWNPAAERIYGITAEQALGRLLSDILTASSLDGVPMSLVPIDAVRSSQGVRQRLVHRPRVGSSIGVQVIVDLAMTGLTDAADAVVGAIRVMRVIGTSARLEAELATLGSLAVATGRGRSREEIAEAALEVLCRATEADSGLIISTDGEFAIAGRIGLQDAAIERILSYGAIGPRLANVLSRPDAALTVDLADSPVAEDIQGALRDEGLDRIAFAGMRVSGRLIGVIGLGWKSRPPTSPSGPVLLEAATLVASALENARLLRRVEHGLELERSLTARLQALVELTRLPDAADEEATIAQFLLERIVSVLGAASGSVARIVDGRLVGLASHQTPPDFARLQASRSASEWGFLRRFAAGETAYIQAIEAGMVSPQILAAADSVGLKAYGAFSFHDEGGLAGVLICGFEQPASELPFDDRTIEAIGRVVDISFANQRLRRVAMASEERYRMVFERSPDALVVTSLEGVVLEANPAAVEMFGGPIVGRSGPQLAEIDPSTMGGMVERIRDDTTFSWSGNGRRLDGTLFPVEAEATALWIGGELRILGLIRDLTERRRLQHELLQAQKMEAIGLLVAGVAHELNNPLASIVAFSQLIRTDRRLPGELHHHADLLIQEANRTRRIVQNLLDFARQRPPERVPTSLPRLIHRVLGLQSYTFGPNRIEAQLEIDEDLPLVALDRAQIQQVLINLTLNAAQAIRTNAERGRITIRASVAEDEDGRPVVRISVTDNGPGIAPHLRSRLFVPFFTTKAPGEGTGLGLSVSFGIAAGHGGSLRYEPGPDGAGATFILELPIDPDAADAADDGWGSEDMAPPPVEDRPEREATPDPDPVGSPERQPTRVLVLDDDTSIRDFLARVLRRDGYEPIVAADGRTALDLVRSEQPDAILCDHRMAGMSGTAFHAAVAEIDPALARRFAFMSGDVLNPELREFALARGITLLAKPFDIDSVGRTVAQILEA